MLSEKKNGFDPSRPAFASLTAGLLARKGEAHPAPAHLDGVSLHAKSAEEYGEAAAPLPPAALPPAAPFAQQAPQARVQSPPPPAPAPSATPVFAATPELPQKPASECCGWTLPEDVLKPLPPGQRHSVGLRLDDNRLRQVKILAARAGASNQKVLLAALDHYLEHMVDTMSRECPCLARSFKNGQ